MLTDVSQTELKYAAQTDTIRRKLMLTAAELQTELIQDSQDDPDLRLDTAEMWIDLAGIERLIGRQRPASIAAQNAIEILEVVPETSRQRRHIQLLANAYRISANIIGGNNLQGSLESHRKSEAMLRNLLSQGQSNSNSDIESDSETIRLDVTLQLGLVLKDAGKLLLDNGNRSEGIAKLSAAQDLLEPIENAHASLALAEIDLAVADVQPQRLVDIEQRIKTLAGYRYLFSSDDEFFWKYLDFFDRLNDKLVRAGDEKKAHELISRFAGGWNRLANKYPTSQQIQSRAAEMELARISSQAQRLPKLAIF